MMTAAEVARQLRERLPHLADANLPRLLYLTQGHHLAHTGHRLFDETIHIRQGAIVVDTARQAAGAPPGEAELNTIGYVASRYGGLTGHDLEVLIQAQGPWQMAHLAPPHRVDLDQLRQWFAAADQADWADMPLDRAEVRAWLATARDRDGAPARSGRGA